MNWLPILGFVALGAFLLQKAARRNAKRHWAWGRAGEGPPLSRKGYAAWGVVFLSIAWVLSGAPNPSFLALAALLASFLAMLGVGFWDSAAARASRGQESQAPH